MPIVIWWIRRDLRIQDNQALYSALQTGLSVLPVYILDPKILNHTAPHRHAFLFEGIDSLQKDIAQLNGKLVIKHGDPLEVLKTLVAEKDAVRIFCEADFTPYAIQRDERIARELPLSVVGAPTILHPASVIKMDGTPYAVFTPYSKKWREQFLAKPISIQLLENIFAQIQTESTPLPGYIPGKYFVPGEKAAQESLSQFLGGQVYQYHQNRNRLDLDGTSRLSPYLKFGMVSARQAAWMVRQKLITNSPSSELEGCETWLNELIWRDFYSAILYYHPNVLHQAFQAKYRNLDWRYAPDDLERWKLGQTGYPVVDAGMRQLLQTGWMHNRARMITASFLVKDLLINWQEGEAWFMQQLVDGDPASNNGGWQWTAGVGTDAAPYFRIFNPTTQGKKFDPTGNYIRTWLPELAGVPNAYIHQPEQMPLDVQQQVGCVIGRNYPKPMVDHAIARERCLQVYRQQKPADG